MGPDAARQNGEFYTPRPLVKFIATVVNPRLGETVLDPACGTGGFLAEAFEHMKKQGKTAGDHRRLQRETLFGIEAKALPYLLCQMNLLLHGVEMPNIDPLNALRFPLREIRFTSSAGQFAIRNRLDSSIASSVPSWVPGFVASSLRPFVACAGAAQNTRQCHSGLSLI